MQSFSKFGFYRTNQTASSTSIGLYKPKHYNYCQPPCKTTPVISPAQIERHPKFEVTDVKAFKDKNEINESNQLQCFKLLILPPPIQHVSITDLDKLQFSSLSYSVRQLIKHSKTIIDANADRKAIGKSFNLNKLIELIAQNYNTTAYHNFTHAFSVLLIMYQSYNRSDTLRKSLTQKKWFYVFIAALAHDLNHPGTTNAFETKKKSVYALDAGNQSVLEKMHLNYFWGILKKNSQVNFLHGYSSNEANEVKRLITRMIMATDVSKHFKGLQNLKEISNSKSALTGENGIIVIEQLFHACDIGNPCLNFDNYMNWSALVTYEFDQVAIQQKQLGLEVTGYLKYENMQKYYAGQVGFCNGLVLPLWKELEALFPGLEEMKNNIVQNIKEAQKWKQSLS